MAVTLHLAGYNCNEITCNTLRKGLAIRRIYLRSNKFFLFVWSPEINKLEKMFFYRIDNLLDFQTFNMCACLFCQWKVINKIFWQIHLLSFCSLMKTFYLIYNLMTVFKIFKICSHTHTCHFPVLIAQFLAQTCRVSVWSHCNRCTLGFGLLGKDTVVTNTIRKVGLSANFNTLLWVSKNCQWNQRQLRTSISVS